MELAEAMKLRSAMKWGVKPKKTEFINGKLVINREEKIYVPVKFLDTLYMRNIIKFLENRLESNPNELWNQYPTNQWINILKWEIQYQNNRANVLISEIMKLPYNELAETFKANIHIAFQPL